MLLAGAYALGTVNRFREGGWRLAPVRAVGNRRRARSSSASALVAGRSTSTSAWLVARCGGASRPSVWGSPSSGCSLSAGGGAAGAAQAAIELFDLVMRLGSNLVSFARLAAFGLTHAALGLVVWQATTGAVASAGPSACGRRGRGLRGRQRAWPSRWRAWSPAMQALRLEYYELFSRIFDGEGRPFRPWHVPLDPTEASMMIWMIALPALVVVAGSVTALVHPPQRRRGAARWCSPSTACCCSRRSCCW